jgi:hypothetical protein
MSERSTIQIPTETFNYHNQRRKHFGLTWEEYIGEKAPDDPVDYDEVEARVREVLNE